VIKLKTATALGFEVTPVFARADEVIEQLL
jgi:hypothetical protein